MISKGKSHGYNWKYMNLDFCGEPGAKDVNLGIIKIYMASQVVLVIKNLPTIQETQV